MSRIKALQEKRKNAAIEARTLLDTVQPENWGASDQEKYDTISAEIEKLDAAIDREQEILQVEAAHVSTARARAEREGISEDEAHGRGEQEKGIFNTFLRGGVNALSNEQREYIDDRRMRNALSTGTDSEGGYLVPTDFASQLIEEMKAFGNMREVADVQQTTSGAPIEWPTVDDTGEEGEILGENTETKDQDPSFGVKTVGAFKYSSKGIAVPFELLQDSGIDLEKHIRNLLAKRLAKITNRHFTLGTGSNQPQGIITGATKGIDAATATGITYDDLLNLEHSVDLDYRTGARWMFSDMGVKTIKSLKDSEGRPLWVPGISVKEPDTILGYQYTVNQFMDAPATGKKSVLFGQLSNYLIRDVMAVTLFRMTDSAYTRKGQVGFLAFSRHDGKLMDASGKSVKYLLHP